MASKKLNLQGSIYNLWRSISINKYLVSGSKELNTVSSASRRLRLWHSSTSVFNLKRYRVKESCTNNRLIFQFLGITYSKAVFSETTLKAKDCIFKVISGSQ